LLLVIAEARGRVGQLRVMLLTRALQRGRQRSQLLFAVFANGDFVSEPSLEFDVAPRCFLTGGLTFESGPLLRALERSRGVSETGFEPIRDRSGVAQPRLCLLLMRLKAAGRLRDLQCVLSNSVRPFGAGLCQFGFKRLPVPQFACEVRLERGLLSCGGGEFRRVLFERALPCRLWFGYARFERLPVVRLSRALGIVFCLAQRCLSTGRLALCRGLLLELGQRRHGFGELVLYPRSCVGFLRQSCIRDLASFRKAERRLADFCRVAFPQVLKSGVGGEQLSLQRRV
jgi:hypothetical protein